MAADLEFEVTSTPAQVKKEVTCIVRTLAAGGKVKMEIGKHELDEAVPAGKSWAVVANIRIIETDA